MMITIGLEESSAMENSFGFANLVGMLIKRINIAIFVDKFILIMVKMQILMVKNGSNAKNAKNGFIHSVKLKMDIKIYETYWINKKVLALNMNVTDAEITKRV